ncbi:polysaccharide pyruvyl transferase family protein [Roseivirga pacifica]|uniref:polysaccharide pyruvyl transferase family protein n=1 Tax=Roseivirga pacifica TaxID=1267423 RepID=UPI003BB14673
MSLKENIHFNIINQQQKLLFECLGSILKKGERVALLDFPNHNNVGDNAIWLGEKEALKKMGVKIVYQCDIYTYSEKALRRHLKNGETVLMHGGGNLGTVWPEHQRFRERMIETLKEFKLIQLPQSVFFKNDEGLERFGKVARSHKDFQVLLRDEPSFKILEALGLNVKLCPDMALALGAVSPKGEPVHDVVWLSRSDHETAGKDETLKSVSVEKLDWLIGGPGFFHSRFFARITVRIRTMVIKIYSNSSFFRNYLWRFNTMFFDSLAWSRFWRGVRILSRGRVVVTDRLHGHIISTLIGKSQVLFDNHYRKIGNYMDCFVSSREALLYLGDDSSEFEEKVKQALEYTKKVSGDEK